MFDRQAAAKWVRGELDACVDFWVKNSLDEKHGGVYTCLDRSGKVYSTDKSVWMQGRCAWTFSALCAQYGARDEWLAVARSCLDFLERYCVNREAGNRLYFTVTGDGKPLRQRRYCFSEGFYAMANAEYAALTGDEACLQRARDAYELVYQLHTGMTDPTGIGAKTIPETRSGRALANPMIYLNLSQVMRRCDPARTSIYSARAKTAADDILRYHFKPDMHCTLENVGKQGECMLDVTEGRIVNPGHDIECSWFLMEQARQTDDTDLLEAALSMFRNAVTAGWDKQYGGLLYFVDCLSLPPESYEHDMKLWWPHTELLIAALMAYNITGDGYYADWFERCRAYCADVFADHEYGEWFGYLRRDGKPTEPPAKGSTFKGPFHLPRALMMLDAGLRAPQER